MRNTDKSLKTYLSHFAKTDGLFKGTATTSNLVCLGCVSILPGFGAYGLLISNAIQLTISGLLEIPSGFFSDRFGSEKSVRLGLVLKLFVTLLFLAAVIAAYYENSNLTWAFFTAEALVDSLASAFLNGAFQMAYLKWFKDKTNGIESAQNINLFLASFSYANTIRFIIPLGILGFSVICSYLIGNNSKANLYKIAIFNLVLIVFLRILLIIKSYIDLTDIKKTLAFQGDNKAKSEKSILSSFKSSYFIIYLNSILASLLSTSYLIGKIFKSAQRYFIDPISPWLIGVGFGLSIYLVKTIFSINLFPRISHLKNSIITAKVNQILIIIMMLATASDFITLDSTFNFYIIAAFTVTCSLLPEIIQKSIEFNLDSILDHHLKVTWISVASAIALLAFGIVSATIVYFRVERYSIQVFSVLISILGFISIFLQSRENQNA